MRYPQTITRAGLSRLRAAAQTRLNGAAIAAGLLPYRPVESPDAEQWEAAHGSGAWDYLSGLPELPRYSLLVGYIRFFGPARSVLDVGCGQGLLVERLASTDFARYLGVDPAASAIARARRLENRDQVRFAVGALPDPACGRFQFIVCNEMLYYVNEPAKTLDRLRDLIEPDGFLLTSIWRHRGDAGLQRLIARRFVRVSEVRANTWTAHGTSRSRVACWQPRSSG